MRKEKYLTGIGNMRDEFISEAAEGIIAERAAKRKFKAVYIIAAAVGITVLLTGSVMAARYMLGGEQKEVEWVAMDGGDWTPIDKTDKLPTETENNDITIGITGKFSTGLPFGVLNAMVDTEAVKTWQELEALSGIDILINPELDTKRTKDITVSPSGHSGLEKVSGVLIRSNYDVDFGGINERCHLRLCMTGEGIPGSATASGTGWENPFEYTSPINGLTATVTYSADHKHGEFSSNAVFVYNEVLYRMSIHITGEYDHDKKKNICDTEKYLEQIKHIIDGFQ